MGASNGILRPSLDEKLNNLHEAIAALTEEPKSEESEEEHVLENFHSSRTIRKLVLDCPAFASTLWKKSLKGKCQLWAQGHRLVALFCPCKSCTFKAYCTFDLRTLMLRVVRLSPFVIIAVPRLCLHFGNPQTPRSVKWQKKSCSP